MKSLHIVTLCLLLGTSAFAQNYSTAIGARVGTGIGITLNQLLLKGLTVEGIIQTNLKEKSSVELLVKLHRKIIIGRSLNFFFGGGYHSGEDNNIDFNGVSGILGLEITLGRLNVSYDYKPQVHLTRGEDTNRMDHHTGLSVRYVLIKKPKWKLKKKKKGWNMKKWF